MKGLSKTNIDKTNPEPSRKWTLEKIKKGFLDFYNEHGTYPTATEIDSYAKLPSSRQIQRVYGGIPALRKKLNLKCQDDLTKGIHSSERGMYIKKRARKLELDVYTYVSDYFGKPSVHKDYFISDNKRNQADFLIYHKGGSFLLDVFYPKDSRSFNGCLNSKLLSCSRADNNNLPIIFLMMNRDIGEDKIKTILQNKKNKLNKNQTVMTFDQFKKYCAGKDPL